MKSSCRDHGDRFLLADLGSSPSAKEQAKCEAKRSLLAPTKLFSTRKLGQYFWICLYLAATALAFISQASKFANNQQAQTLLGFSVVVSRGAAQCLNLNCALILLPTSRSLVTRLIASERIPTSLPSMTAIHHWLGMAILFWTVIHCGGHICNCHQISHADPDHIHAMLGDRLFGATIPEGAWPRWKGVFFRTRAGVTGILMLLCMAVAYPLLSHRRNNFESFWISHHLLIVMLVLVCIHGSGNIVEKHQSIYWISIPLLLYVIPRLWRGPSDAARVLSAQLDAGGNVLCLRVSKPRAWRASAHKAGMYACLRVPAIAMYESHPFTMTSVPEDNFLEFHIKKAGNWTADLMKNVDNLSRLPPAALPRVNDMTVRVDGPFAASTTLPDYPIIALIVAGIGVTPAMSVLKRLLKPGLETKAQRVRLYWTLRHDKVPEWFQESLRTVWGKALCCRVLRAHYFLTGAKPEARNNVLIKQQHNQEVHAGRPDWDKELRRLRNEARALGHSECAVLFCGSDGLASALEDAIDSLEVDAAGFQFHVVKEASF